MIEDPKYWVSMFKVNIIDSAGEGLVTKKVTTERETQAQTKRCYTDIA